MLRDLAQPSHLLILAVLLLLLFGWKKLPDISRSVGRSMRIFKSEVTEMKNDGTQARPSPAASDTVPGGVVPPQPQSSPDPQSYSNGAAQPAAGAPQPPVTDERTQQAPHDYPAR